MMADTTPDLVREKLAHIDRMLADLKSRHKQFRTTRARQGWLFIGVTAAALFAAGAALEIFVKLYLGWFTH